MLKYMLDTNICVYVLKNYPPNLRGRFANLTSRLSISAITLGELCYGAEKSGRRRENMEEVKHLLNGSWFFPFRPRRGDIQDRFARSSSARARVSAHRIF